MKVVMISYYWIKGQGGGIENYLKNLVSYLNDKDIEVSVIFKEGYDQRNFRIEGSICTFIIRSFFLLRKMKPEVIHTHETWYYLFVGCLYKKLYHVKLIHTFHNEPSHEISKFGKIVYSYLIDSYDVVSFVSNNLIQKNYVLKGITSRNSVVTYAGVQSININDISQQEIDQFCNSYNIKTNSIVLLAQGFISNKLKKDGAKLLIKAIKKLKNKYPTILLLLTGDGLYLDELKNFSNKNHASENVIFTGLVHNPLIPLKICDIYTHTPLGEGGVSLALLEAMSMGKPIVAASVGGIPEVIDNEINGFLVEPKVDSITNMVTYLLENKEVAAKIGYNAKRTVEERFTWEKTTEAFLKLYFQPSIDNI